MDNDDDLTNLSWLKIPIQQDRRSNKVECMKNDIDDDLQCLCWLNQIRPRLSSHFVKRLSVTNKTFRLLSSTENITDVSNVRRISLIRTCTNSSSNQSWILIRLSNGKMFCLSFHRNSH